ncbi:hypothetical protein BGZ72_004104 [Mortierella alpina]|nr:hypothetical protein BGZ72_004104 [Mortierella alpina]
MRFVLSVLLATAFLGSLITADERQGQQTAFRLESQHVHHEKSNRVKHSQHHLKASSHKERRNLQQQASFVAPAVPECHNEHCKRDSLHKKAAKNEDTELAFHRKISRNRKTRELGQKKKTKIEKRSAAKKLDSKKVVKNEDTELAFHRKISRKRKTRELGQRKNKVEKRNVVKKHSGKKILKNEDTELAFHRRISRNRKTRELGQKKNKVQKRSPGRKGTSKKNIKNEDTELAFHRRISRNRKTRELGQK